MLEVGGAGCCGEGGDFFVGGCVVAFAGPGYHWCCSGVVGYLGLGGGSGVADYQLEVFWDGDFGVGDVFVVGAEAHGV